MTRLDWPQFLDPFMPRLLVFSWRVKVGPCIIHVIHAAMNALISCPSCIAARSRFASNLHRLSPQPRFIITLSAWHTVKKDGSRQSIKRE